jgi:protein-S-isoprenylcysteine O-methyltransferase Ste14
MAFAFLAAQALFVALFFIRALVGHSSSAQAGASEAQKARAAPRALGLLALHAVGIILVVWGITNTFNARHGQMPASPLAFAGLLILLAASGLAWWALRVFRSWRLLPRLDAGHALCVDGPFRFVRHPIYLAMDVWAAGSALACPATMTLVGLVFVIVGSDVRARAEEKLLLGAFGDEYRAYMDRVRRFVPGLY